ncbi:hypothetical protein AURDEDRAFT_154025 [Auricularia subglabra TFB-10046 SS5]|nr:hypothetical protein AURDEDRAFT_154025 [Auricularia subglabra TFB-10046 SS5]
MLDRTYHQHAESDASTQSFDIAGDQSAYHSPGKQVAAQGVWKPDYSNTTHGDHKAELCTNNTASCTQVGAEPPQHAAIPNLADASQYEWLLHVPSTFDIAALSLADSAHQCIPPASQSTYGNYSGEGWPSASACGGSAGYSQKSADAYSRLANLLDGGDDLRGEPQGWLANALELGSNAPAHGMAQTLTQPARGGCGVGALGSAGSRTVSQAADSPHAAEGSSSSPLGALRPDSGDYLRAELSRRVNQFGAAPSSAPLAHPSTTESYGRSSGADFQTGGSSVDLGPSAVSSFHAALGTPASEVSSAPSDLYGVRDSAGPSGSTQPAYLSHEVTRQLLDTHDAYQPNGGINSPSRLGQYGVHTAGQGGGPSWASPAPLGMPRPPTSTMHAASHSMRHAQPDARMRPRIADGEGRGGQVMEISPERLKIL